jgi:uncharacterized protein with FMN-binding domain
VSTTQGSGSIRRIVLAVTSTVSGLIMLFSYHTSTMGAGAPLGSGSTTGGGSTGTTGTTGTTGSTGTSGTSATPTPSATSGSGSPASSGSSPAKKTYTGQSVDTRWGPVQVQITVVAGKVTNAEAVVYPSGNGRDAEINSYALPILHDEAVKAQSAKIDLVSGATVTSDGYVQSLQSALDAAHI